MKNIHFVCWLPMEMISRSVFTDLVFTNITNMSNSLTVSEIRFSCCVVLVPVFKDLSVSLVVMVCFNPVFNILTMGLNILYFQESIMCS